MQKVACTYFTSAFNAKKRSLNRNSLKYLPKLSVFEYQSSITTVSASSTQSHKMSEVSEDRSVPTGQTPASAEPQPAEAETKLATTASGTEAEPSNETSTTESKLAYTEMASNVAGSTAAAAAGVKDSVFSMFGGGGAKERK